MFAKYPSYIRNTRMWTLIPQCFKNKMFLTSHFSWQLPSECQIHSNCNQIFPINKIWFFSWIFEKNYMRFLGWWLMFAKPCWQQVQEKAENCCYSIHYVFCFSISAYLSELNKSEWNAESLFLIYVGKEPFINNIKITLELTNYHNVI